MALVIPLQMEMWDDLDHFPGRNPGPRFSPMTGPLMLGPLLGLERWAAPLPPPCITYAGILCQLSFHPGTPSR